MAPERRRGKASCSRASSAFFFVFFCNTSPKPQLQCSQEAGPIYIESPTSPSQGSAGRQAGVTAAAGRCKVVNYATKWTSQRWSPHTPCPGAVADNLGVLSGRVPVLSGYPITRRKHWYIGRETRGSGGGEGGWQWATRARWVAHRGKKEMAFHSHGVGVGVGVPREGQPANGWRKNRDTEGDWGAHRRVHGRGGSIKHNWLLCCAGLEGGTRLKRRRGVGTPGVTDEAKLAKQHTISPRLMTVPTEFRGPST